MAGASARRVWWRQDRRWVPRLGVAGTAAALGGAVVWLGSGLAATMSAEAGFAVAAGFTVATGTALRQAWRGRADDDPGTYAAGLEVDLVPTGTLRGAPIARLTDHDGVELATLHLETLHPADAPAGGIDTVTARVAGRVLRLQHRCPSAGTLNGSRPAHPAADLEVSWVDDAGRPAATASRVPDGEGDRWRLTGRDTSLAWTVPPIPGRRPRRRLLRQDGRDGRVFLLVHTQRRRLPRTHATLPCELHAPEVLLAVWLCHLLDTHAAAREPWPPATEDWALVGDDFPASTVGPAGFGRTAALPSSGGGGYYPGF